MIVKMKFINISGPRNDIDRVTDLYLATLSLCVDKLDYKHEIFILIFLPKALF